IRNFGQIVPSGFGNTWQNTGRKSLAHYLDIQKKTNVHIRQEGSLYVASDGEEATLLEELHEEVKGRDYSSPLLTPVQVLTRYPNIKKEFIKAALFFPEEICADSRLTIPAMSRYFESLGMKTLYNRLVPDIYYNDKEVLVFDNLGDKWIADQAILCDGDDFATLFPDVFAKSDIELVKLQMMETAPQKNGVKILGSVLTGWTIRRYESF